MSSSPIQSYLHDHLAGATGALDKMRALHDECADESIRQLMARLLGEVAEDRAALETLAQHVQATGSHPVKEAASWAGEKISRFKLRHGGADGAGLLETLEALMLGVAGKQALWRALQVGAPRLAKSAGIDLDQLIERAQDQASSLDTHRLRIATSLFAPES